MALRPILLLGNSPHPLSNRLLPLLWHTPLPLATASRPCSPQSDLEILADISCLSCLGGPTHGSLLQPLHSLQVNHPPCALDSSVIPPLKLFLFSMTALDGPLGRGLVPPLVAASLSFLVPVLTSPKKGRPL
ncbi:hypothetical protein GOP47_0009946 [Adiantum capillus-veneris]|uniref:Uncharacterized protein n=1 Tax=Adiantum capillus-veneris TaxID=13818 RepID=A0A9D4UX90_ADICA|nr:hypothetical protein GOP47_0009946 [Adiantum capillus-veneris]